MKLTDYGEDRLIAELTRGLPAGKRLQVGVGDDCAVIGGKRDALWLLLKTDCVVEGVHFLPGTDPKKIGWKAMARAISDIAAMSGLPRFALITLAVGPDADANRLKAIYAGLRKAAKLFGVAIVGGETSRSPGPMFLSISLTGDVEPGRCVTRSGGRPGDSLYVTGRLGGSLRGRHLTFMPRVAEARWLTANFRLHAMMDLSDGLGSDLPRLARASGAGFELFEDHLPRNKSCTPQDALTDGEDYELLFALAARDSANLEARWHKQFPKLPLTRIGALTPKSEIGNRKSKIPPRGYDHFA